MNKVELNNVRILKVETVDLRAKDYLKYKNDSVTAKYGLCNTVIFIFSHMDKITDINS